MLRQFSARRIIVFFLFDCLGTLAVFSFAASLRIEFGNLPNPFLALLSLIGIREGGSLVSWATIDPYRILVPQVFVLVALIWPFYFVVFSVYDGRRNETLTAELLNVFLATCISTITLAGLLYLTYRETSRVVFVIFFFLDVLLLLSGRVALWGYRLKFGPRRSSRRAVIVVGARSVGRNVVQELKKHAWANIDLAGYVDDDPRKLGQEVCGMPVLGTLADIAAIVAAHHVRDAVVALPLRAHRQIVETCQTLQSLDVRVCVVPDLFALSFPSATLDGFGGIPVIDLGRPSVEGWHRVAKRTFDTLAVTPGLILLSPLLLIIAIAIKLDSPGPVLYRQSRVGENGRLFTMLKFRSMQIGASEDVHKAHVQRIVSRNLSPEELNGNRRGTLKMGNDTRVTRVGRIIRKTSLDELPQLFNVLRGEMSLVGPRPDVPYAVELYNEWHKRRFKCLPGLTGWWQVKGRNRVSYDEMIRMDIYYIEHMSFWLDLKILLLTPWAMVSGRGAG
jgi:exopolysaccharide biosynthesis polyprenyl glycosylphosphotransferase